MATNSLIGIERDNNKVEYVYCHFDGYLEGVGDTLVNNYDTTELEELLKNGDLSALESCVDDCNFYKDRGEEGTESRIVDKSGYKYGSDTNFYASYRYLLTKDRGFVCYVGESHKKPEVVEL